MLQRNCFQNWQNDKLEGPDEWALQSLKFLCIVFLACDLFDCSWKKDEKL